MPSFTKADRQRTGYLSFFSEDHGRYVVSFLCQWGSGDWKKVETGERIGAAVIGWRARVSVFVDRLHSHELLMIHGSACARPLDPPCRQAGPTLLTSGSEAACRLD